MSACKFLKCFFLKNLKILIPDSKIKCSQIKYFDSQNFWKVTIIPIQFLQCSNQYKISKKQSKNETDIMHRELLKTIKNNGPYEFIVCMGDVMHNKNSITLSVYNRALEFLYDISKYSHLYLIVGNHDRQSEKDFLSDVSPFKPLKGKENITVIDQPLNVSIQGLNFTFVPFVEPGRFKEALSYISDQKWKESDTIFAHQEFLGSTPSGVGDEWDQNLPQVFTGHVHSYLKLWNGKVIYVSTPLQNSSIETGRKGVVEVYYTHESTNNLSNNDETINSDGAFNNDNLSNNGAFNNEPINNDNLSNNDELINNHKTTIFHRFIDLDVPRTYTYSCKISEIAQFNYNQLFQYFNTDPNISSLKIFVYGSNKDVQSSNWIKEINQNSNIQLHLRSIENSDVSESDISINVNFWERFHSNISKSTNSNQLYSILNNLLAN